MTSGRRDEARGESRWVAVGRGGPRWAAVGRGGPRWAAVGRGVHIAIGYGKGRTRRVERQEGEGERGLNYICGPSLRFRSY